MKALTEYLARSLVESPDEVEVTQSRHGNRVRLQLRVSKDDMGRVIGRGGVWQMRFESCCVLRLNATASKLRWMWWNLNGRSQKVSDF
jgi:hypothetical protein